MVAPFKSYYRETKRTRPGPHGPQVLYLKTMSGVTQKPPFVDTAYTMIEMKRLSGESDPSSWSVPSLYNMVEARNQARAKFVNKLGDASSFGATLTAERKATWGTVVSGITRAALAAKAVSRGQLGKAARHLGLEPPVAVIKPPKGKKRRKGPGSGKYTTTLYRLPGGKEGSQQLGNKWLWYSYGIKPLVGDIYNGMDVLQRPTPSTRVEGRGKTFMTFTSTYYINTFESSVRCSADVRVKNPNLWLANQLGLVNPVQWINEGIPFSFVLDWFSNLSQVISQLTDFVGLEIENPITTEVCIQVETQKPPFSPYVKQRTTFSRTLTLPTAKLRFAYERFQWQRGANAISLLLQFLPKK